MPGWTVEFWTYAVQSGPKPVPGTVFFEFRDPIYSCGTNWCKNGDDPVFANLDNGYFWSFVVLEAEGNIQILSEIRSNGTGSYQNVDYKPILYGLTNIDANTPQHIAVTVRPRLLLL